jgi:D-alanyl-D-alanine endopeptidase (penicillin-binding protein 7)
MKKFFIAGMFCLMVPAWANGAYGVRDWNEYQWTHSSNVEDVRSIASITKLFTALAVLQSDVDLKQAIPVKGNVSGRYPVGTKVPRVELLRATLISSDNRAAESLAHAHPGGRQQLLNDIQSMIEYLGLKNTKIVDPTGLGAGNVSTVEDLTDFMFYLRNNWAIRSISAEKIHESKIPKGKKTVKVVLRNTNPAVFTYDNILISKTGTTNAAGKCVAMLVEKGGEIFALVVLGQKNSKDRQMIVQELMK